MMLCAKHSLHFVSKKVLDGRMKMKKLDKCANTTKYNDIFQMMNNKNLKLSDKKHKFK